MITHLSRAQFIWFGLGGLLVLDSLLLLATGRVNLGTVIPGCFGVAILTAIWKLQTIGRLRQRPAFNLAWRALMVGLMFWLISLTTFVAWTLQMSKVHSQNVLEIRYLIVLGAGLRGTDPSPTLKARLDIARQVAETNKSVKLLVSGGQGHNEIVSEANAMSSYLQRHGVPPERILSEDRSTSTMENLSFSADILKAQKWQDGDLIGIVTSDFHVVRAYQIAIQAGFANISMMPAPTPIWILPNSWLREYFAMISSWLAGEIFP